MNSYFLELYDDKKVIYDSKGSVKGYKLYDNCPNKDICWKNIESQKADWNIIPFPYIGSDFRTEEHSIAIIGLNLNGHGGISSLRDLILDAQYALRKGWVKIRFSLDYKRYRGTYLFHRAAVYSNIIRDKYTNNNSSELSPKKLASIWDKVCYLEAIKCSPANNSNSKPSSEMYKICPKEYLLKELQILKPKVLIVLGKDTINPYELFKVTGEQQSANANFYYYTISDNPIKCIYKVVHPSARGSNRNDVIAEFQTFCSAIG